MEGWGGGGRTLGLHVQNTESVLSMNNTEICLLCYTCLHLCVCVSVGGQSFSHGHAFKCKSMLPV